MAHARIGDQPCARNGPCGRPAAFNPDYRVLLAVDDKHGHPQASQRVPLAACEVMQAAVVPAVVTESATPQTVGRYTSAYQVTFSIGDIIVPAIVTMALHASAAAF